MAPTAAQVKELRERTGLGIVECRNALNETNSDIEAAIDLLRKSGQVKREKKAGRAQNEGMIVSAESNGKTAFVEFRCETDFVSRNEDVRSFIAAVALEAAKNCPADSAALNAMIVNGKPASVGIDALIAKIGENLSLGAFKVMSGAVIGSYVHHDKKSGAMVQIEGSASKDIADDIAMHIVFAQPAYLVRTNVPESAIRHERDIIIQALKEDPKMANKPIEMLEKISTGKLDSFYKETVLTDQPHYRETKMSVSEFLDKASKGSNIKDFFYVKVGGSSAE